MENKKTNTGLIVTVVVLVMLLLFGCTLLVLSSMGYLNFGDNVLENQENEDSNVNNDSEENNESLVLRVGQALEISKELVNKYFEYYHSLGVYCGESNGQDYLSFGSYQTGDFRDYSASTEFKSIDELKSYFGTFMVEDLFPNYLNDGISYLEKDGKLYCQLSHKGPGEDYNEGKSTYTISSIEENKFIVDVILVSDVVDLINKREGTIEIIKDSNNNWLISKYDVMISER